MHFKHQFLEREICPACAGNEVREIFSSRFDQPPISDYLARFYGRNKIPELTNWLYRLDQCQECELVFQRYIGNKQFLSKLYDSWLSTEDHQTNANAAFADLLKTPGATRDGHELMWASKFLGRPLSTMRTLDYGMGWALWGRIAKELGCESFGFDLSRVRMAAAAQAGIRVLEADNFPADSFDFINTEQVFEHIPDPLALAGQLSKALRPGGILKISVPSGADILRRLRIGNWAAEKRTKYSLNPVAPLEHINCFTEKTLTRIGENVGLVPIKKSIFKQFAFLTHKGAINLRAPREAVKAFARPWYRFHNRLSLYIWLQRSA